MRTLIAAAVFTLVLVAIWYSGGNSDFDDVAYVEKQTGLSLNSQIVDVGEVKLHVVFAGPENGEPIILVHGFPQFWYLWRHHISMLAEAGYRVAAPDLRGFNRSDKPAGKSAYEFKDFARDIIGLMDSQQWVKANVVGHDIGARVTWQLIFDAPERISRAVVVSVGHPLAFEVATGESDVSWYRTFLQLPLIPEFFSRVGGLSFLANTFRGEGMESSFSEEDIEIYKKAWDRDHAFDSMIGVYSHFDAVIDTIPEDGVPAMPVLFLYGLGDVYISNEVAHGTKQYLSEQQVKIYPELSHWLLEEDPEMTGREILDFISADFAPSTSF